VQQIFVRDAAGKVYGPLEPVTVELLIDGGVLNGALLVSTDGVRYGSPARYPALKDYFPRHLWGDDGEAPSTGDAVPVLLAADVATLATPTPQPAAAVAPAPKAPPPPAVAPAPRPAAPSSTGPAPTGQPGVLPRVTAAIPAVSQSPTLANNVVPAIPPMAPTKKTPTGGFTMAPPATRPTPSAGTSAVLAPPPVAETRFSSGPSGATSPPKAPTPPSVMPVPPRASTPRPPPAERTPGASYMVASGDLAEISAIRLYAQAAETNVTGLFTFKLSDRSILVHFRKGNPEFIDSTHPEDAVEGYLSKATVVTAEQLKVAHKERGRFGGEVLATLFALGLVNPSLVFPVLTQRAATLLLRAFLAPAGLFEYQPLELQPNKALPLGNRWGFLAETMRRYPLGELKRRLRDVRKRPLVRRGDGGSMPDLRFTAQEMRAFGYFDGTRSLALLAESHPTEMETILRVALLLRELDALSFPEVELKGGAAPTGETSTVPPPPPPPAAAPQSTAPPRVAAQPLSPTPSPASAPRAVPSPTPSPAASSRAVASPTPAPSAPPRAFLSTPTPVPGTPVDFPTEIQMLRSRLAKGKSLNHFQILGLSEKADGAAVKAAYFKLAKLYHPDTVPPEAPPELAELKAQAFSVVGEASRVLGDDQSRADYLESLKSGGGNSVDVRQVLAAEDTFHKGVAFIKARRFVEAVKTLDDAITLNPREGEFYAWRGYARFFTSVDKKASLVDAMRDLHHALKLNERCAAAHYLIGQLHKLSGDNTLALKHFKKCVSLDAAHVDAQREIRLLVGR
jgi:DnaJ domain/Tetratricopeptide repeat